MSDVKRHASLLRKRLSFWLVLAVVLTPATIRATGQKSLVFVGTYTGKGSEGIYGYRFDSATGALTPLGLAAKTPNPSFLAVDEKGRFLYAANELDAFGGEAAGGISVFEIDRETGKLRLAQQVSSLGAGPAHLSIDKTGRYLLVANYNGGNVAVFPIGDDGRLGAHSALEQHAGASVNPGRQAGPHAHSILVSNDNRFALSADLGTDQLFVYRFDAAKGSLAPDDPAFAKVKPGSGPRHFVFSPSGKWVYLTNELASTVTVFSYDARSGALMTKQTVRTLPKTYAGENLEAEIVVDAKGRFLYVSNRGDDSIVVFSINAADGTLSFVQRVPSGGKTPRNFAIDPSGSWLFAANQESNNIRLFRVDPGSGRLMRTPETSQTFSPACVIFVPMK